MHQMNSTMSNDKPLNYLFASLSFEALFLSKKGICVAQNQAAKDIFGYSDEEAIGRPGTDWIHPDDRALVAQKMKEKYVQPYKVLALRKNGTTFPCEIQAKDINHEGEKIRVTALRSISKQQSLENELSDKIKELEIITDSIPNSIWKAKISKDGQISETYISSSVDQLLGLPPGTINSDWEKYFSFILPEYLDKLRETIQAGIENPGQTFTVRYQIKKEDGSLAWFSSCGKGELEGDEVIAYGFTYDITAKKEKEDQLQTLMATKDKFFSIISHDLRNPFTAFMGFSELMLRQLKKGQYDNIEKYARAIYSTARSGGELLSNLLDWSRSQRGKITFRPEKINLHELVQSVLMFFDEPARSKEIKIESTIASDITLMADHNMLNTILRNLVSNAIKYSYRNTTINISITQQNNRVLLEVADIGQGMEPEQQQKLFRIDSNESVPGTEEEKGTGLGLILCKEFVDKHNGQIKVESQPGEGSKFTVILPLKPQA